MNFFNKINLKTQIKNSFEHLYWFFGRLKYRILIGAVFSFIVAILDAFGLSMFLPLLQMLDEKNPGNTSGKASFGFVVQFIDRIGFNLNLETILVFITFFFLLKGLIKYLSITYRVYLEMLLISMIRHELLGKLNGLKYKYFVSLDIGRIQNTMTGEVDRIQKAYANYFLAFEQIIMVAIYFAFAIVVDFQFSMLVAIGGLCTQVVYKGINRGTRSASSDFTYGGNKYHGLIVQHVLNYKYLKSTGLLSKFSDRLIFVLNEIERSRKKISLLTGLLSSSKEPLMILVVTSVIYIQIKILGGSLGAIMISLLFFYRALTALSSLQNAWNEFLTVSGSLNNMTNYLNSVEVNQDNRGEIFVNSLNTDVVLEDLEYRINNKIILTNINFKIKKNNTYAIVGESGSGKTTLMNLISGLVLPTRGNVFVNQVPTNKLDIESFQSHLGYVSQDPIIFNDTVFNNVTFWAERNTLNYDRCIDSLKKASIFDFIQQLPEGIDTILDYNGLNISGGQKQRISIARELYKNVDFIIFDEATSALDSETEKSIQRSLELLHGHATILIVAHRLSTIKHVDSILVLNEGRVVCAGTYEEVEKNCNYFKRLLLN
jgi:ABC-type multidrug transport system fused ATPase/permease subunit